jgi:D-alanyl-D-alanine carboxypeptidase (penicillin-binding protein 5/6)
MQKSLGVGGEGVGHQTRLRALLCLVLLLPGYRIVCAAEGVVHPPHTDAPQVFVMDARTRTVLFARQENQPVGPSSMTKIMTAYMVFEKMKKGLVSGSDRLPVSEKAWRMQGSKMFLSLGSSVSVEDLLRGVVVVSGNDACVALAEGLWGEESVLAGLMTEKARALGATGTVFLNSSGWPEPGHVSTVRDLGYLAAALIEDFPGYYGLFSEKDMTWNDIHQMNRNPLLYTDLKADGVKTGNTEAAGYGLVGSAVRDGFRVIVVVNGLKSAAQRAKDSEILLRWAFREFESPLLFRGGQTVCEVPVWLGQDDTVAVEPVSDVQMTLPKGAFAHMRAEVVFAGPVPSPVRKGQHIADLCVHVPGQEDRKIPLVASAPVESASFWRKAPDVLHYLLWGYGNRKDPEAS